MLLLLRCCDTCVQTAKRVSYLLVEYVTDYVRISCFAANLVFPNSLALSFFSDPSSAGVGCAKTGPIQIADNIAKGKEGEVGIRHQLLYPYASAAFFCMTKK